MRTMSDLRLERTRGCVAEWFDEMKAYLDKKDRALLTSPDRLYNVDDIGFSVCPQKSNKGVTERGAKHVNSKTMQQSVSSVTVLASCSATGHYISPFIIFPQGKKTSWSQEGFEEAHFTTTRNGRITADVFITWLRDRFFPAVAHVPKPIVLFVNGHALRYFKLEAAETCVQNQIIVYCMKSRSSFWLQTPLDHAVFGTLKNTWQEQLKRLLQVTGESVGVRTFAKSLKPVWNSTTAHPKLAADGFARSGIYPFNPSRVLSSVKLWPNNTFVSPTEASFNEAVSIATAPPPATVPPTSGTERAKNMKGLLDFAARIGRQRLDYLWDQLVSGSDDLKEFRSLLEKVGFDTAAVNSNNSVGTTSAATCSHSIARADIANETTTVAAVGKPREYRKRKLQEQQDGGRKRVEQNNLYLRKLQQKEPREMEKKSNMEEKRSGELPQQSHWQDDDDNEDEDEDESTESASSESDDSNASDQSDGECEDVEEEEEEEEDVCQGCGDASDGVWVRCDVCNGWWHTMCTKDAAVRNRSKSELEDTEFVCSKCVVLD